MSAPSDRPAAAHTRGAGWEPGDHRPAPIADRTPGRFRIRRQVGTAVSAPAIGAAPSTNVPVPSAWSGPMGAPSSAALSSPSVSSVPSIGDVPVPVPATATEAGMEMSMVGQACHGAGPQPWAEVIDLADRRTASSAMRGRQRRVVKRTAPPVGPDGSDDRPPVDRDANPGVPTGQDLSDAGMSTVEYAVGTIAAAAFGAVLYKIVTGGSVISGLTELINSALHTSL